jgi:hypothetical protein
VAILTETFALTGGQNNNINTPPQKEDIQWKNFTTTLNLEYISTNTNLFRQGGYNYTSTNLNKWFIYQLTRQQ